MPTGRANARPMTGSAWRLEGWMQHADSRPSFETLAEFIIGPRFARTRWQAPQDEVHSCLSGKSAGLRNVGGGRPVGDTILFAPFRPGTAHIVIFRPVPPVWPVPRRTKRRTKKSPQRADGAAQEGEYCGGLKLFHGSEDEQDRIGNREGFPISFIDAA
jgi:hypothetical protein